MADALKSVVWLEVASGEVPLPLLVEVAALKAAITMDQSCAAEPIYVSMYVPELVATW